MNVLYIHLFGKFEICYDDELQTKSFTPQVQELLAYILIHHERPQTRDKLLDLFWNESDTHHAKRQLRQLLWRYNSASKLCHDDMSDLLIVEPGWVSFNKHTNVLVDIIAFEQAVSDGRGQRADHDLSITETEADMAERLRQAFNLYRGDLLEGWYQDWCLIERERFQNLYLATLDDLMRYCEVQGDSQAAQQYGQQILRYNRANEYTHQRLMRLHHIAGDTSAALRQFENCATALREELDISPSENTLSLHRMIRSQHQRGGHSPLPQARADDDVNFEAHPLSSRLAAVADHLIQLQSTLADLQSQIQQDLHSLQQILKGQ